MKGTSRALLCAAWFMLCFISISAWAKDPPIYTALFSKTALGGYDAVSYFTDQRPVKGVAQFVAPYKGAEWRFSSLENRDKFLADPERFAPQYGGYCAWAVSQGYTASGDPLRWKIVDNKLYLNYDADVQKKWEKSIPEFIKSADRNWPAALDN
jgi:YHS domain-containing protein